MVAFNPVWKNFNPFFRTRLMLTQYTPFWCLFHALCLYLLFMTRPTQLDRIQILVTLVSGIDKEKRTLSVCCSKFELEISIPHWWFVCLIWRRFAPARCASFTSLSRLKRRKDCVSKFIQKQQKQVYLSKLSKWSQILETKVLFTNQWSWRHTNLPFHQTTDRCSWQLKEPTVPAATKTTQVDISTLYLAT